MSGIHIGENGYVLKIDGIQLPYPTEVKPSNAIMRTVSPTRTGLLNIAYGGGKVKAIPTYNISWAYMTLEDYAMLDSLIKEKAVAQQDIDFYCMDISTNEMTTMKAYVQDDGLVIGGVQYTYDKQLGGTKLIGYKNVSTQIIATLNDDPEVIAANNAVISED